MSKEADEQKVKDQITGYVLGELGGLDKIKEVEDNAGSMWVTTKDGKTYSVSVMECEPQE